MIDTPPPQGRAPAPAEAPQPRGRTRGWPVSPGAALSWLATLALGAVGGALFFWLRMPLPWMLGALLVTMAGSLGGLRLGLPGGLRGLMLMVLGVMLGSAFTPEVLGNAGRWLISIAVMIVFVTVASVLTQAYLRRAAGMNGVTAFFAAAPGGLSAMAFLGGAMGGDERDIALIHSARILLVATIIPFGIRIAEGALATRQIPTSAALQAPDAGLLIGCGLLGYALARAVRMPAPQLIGPMLLSVAAHLTGLTAGRPPVALIALAQVVLGSSVGCRFSGVSLQRVWRALSVSLGSTAVLLAGVLAVAWAMHLTLGQDMEAAILAYAPGGLPEMTLIALTLDIDVAYVAVHHLVRVMYIMLLAPVVFRAFPEWYREPGAVAEQRPPRAEGLGAETEA